MTELRADAVDFLAEAYRHRDRSAFAAMVVASRHLDYSIAECRAALTRVLGEMTGRLAELMAERIVLLELGRLEVGDDPVLAQGEVLLTRGDRELDELLISGALDPFLHALGLDPDEFR